MTTLHCNLNLLSNIGSFYQKKLNRLKLLTVFDLITYAPRSYETRQKSRAMRDLVPGEKIAVVGKILDARIQTRRTRMLLVTLGDETGLLTLRFFRFYPNQLKQFEAGKTLYAFGEIRQVGGNFEMTHPDCRFLEAAEIARAQSLPLYPLSEGLTQNRLRGFIESAFKSLGFVIPAQAGIQRSGTCQLDSRLRGNDNLPAEIIQQFSLQDFWTAVYCIHFPDETVSVEQLIAREHPAQIRLIFEELLAHRLALKQPDADNTKAKPILIDHTAVAEFIKALPFVLSPGQTQAIKEILADLQTSKAMQRLLQGDVGSGKTLVALVSSFVVIKAGQQVVLMAPTEILAEQLYQKAQELFQPFAIQVIALMGKLSPKAKKVAYAHIESGEAQFIIGTQAVIQTKVIFQDIGLIIVDEQHRFGVGQRLQLHQKSRSTGFVPHQLIMSATPIPRTLAMTLYADLDISNIVEAPTGRQPIETALIGDQRREEIIQRLKQACLQGEQVYWICPLIEESEKLELEAAEATFERLRRDLPDIPIALLHGRMKGTDKSAIMQAFKAGEVKILVATTVVEVGIDVQNASIIIIENPERMGLSQLHQLRGRVGRGHKKSFCILLYHPPLSETSMARLATLRHSQNGFDLAEKDLELRGPGEFLGTRQTGGVEFRFASLIRDQKWLKRVHHAAEIMRTKYPAESKQLIDKWFSQGVEFVKV